MDPLRISLELLRHSLELLKRFFNIQRASRSLAKTGLCFHFFGDFFSALFQVVSAASLWGGFGALWGASGAVFWQLWVPFGEIWGCLGGSLGRILGY